MSNKQKVFSVLEDRKPHSTFEIMEILFPNGKAGLFRLSAYIGFLKDDGHEIEGWFDKLDHKKYWYHLKSREQTNPQPAAELFSVQQTQYGTLID